MEHTRLPVWRVPRAIAALIALALVATSVLVAQAPANAAVLGVSVARVPATAPPPARTDPPGGVWLGQFITYAVAVSCPLGVPCTAVVATVPTPAATSLDGIPPNSTAVPGGTDVSLGDIPDGELREFTIRYKVLNNAGPTFDVLNPEPLISLSGVSATDASGPVVTQVGTIDTPSFQFPPALTNVTSASNPFSGKRSQTIRGNAGLSAGPDVFDYLASIYVVDVPAGANITIATTSPLQPGCTWTLPTLPHTSVTQAYLICEPVPPAASAGPTLPFLIMEFPASHPNFPNGAVATINTRAYIVETGADPNWSTLFDPSVALQDPLSGITQIIDDTPPNSSTSVGPFEVDDRMNARLSVDYLPTDAVPSVNSMPLGAAYTGAIAAPQDTMTITSGGNPLFYEHHVLQNLRVTAILTDPLADYTNLYAEVTVRQFDGVMTTRDVPIPNINGVNLIFSSSLRPMTPPQAPPFVLPSNSPVASYEVVIRKLDPPSGNVVSSGLSIGSTYGVSAGYHTSYLSVVNGAPAPLLTPLQHCQTWVLAPSSLSSVVCATSTVFDGFPLGTTPLAVGGVLAEGASTNVTIGFTNGEARRTITGATMTVVLPPGFSYTGGPIPTVTTGGFGKSPSLSPPLPAPTVVSLPGFPFGFTRLTFALPDLVPVTPWITYVPTGGFQSKDYQWSLPIQVASTAYNPPASDNSRITVAVTAASLTPWRDRYVYLPAPPGLPPSELGLGNVTLPWTQSSFRVSVIGQIRGTSAVFDAPTSGFDDSTTVVAGNPATIRRTVLNTFIGPVSVLRLYDRIPRSGVDGSTFTATLTGPPVVVSPGAWTTLVSTFDNPCRVGFDPDPALCSGSYLPADLSTVWPAVRSLLFVLVTPLPSNGRSEITYQIDTPAAASAGAQALSRFSMFGSTFNGAVFSEVLSGSARVLLTAAPAAAAPPSPSPAGMALTGLQPSVPAVGAFFALLLGSVMLLIVRRSRRPR